MKLGDIVALARAGYSASDVKELLEKEVPEQPEVPEEPKEEIQEVEEKLQEPKDDDSDEPDYKALYEESQKKLQEAQKLNLQKEIVVDDDKNMNALTDAIRGFM